jgi:peptidoglycan/LPS O-acetylase OafA/YrhL
MAESGRIGYIDGLRAIAVLAVVACHDALFMPMWRSILAHPASVPFAALGHALVDGSHGVDLFFVLSGFCLAHPTLVRLAAEGRARFDLVRYGTLRIGRILPPYYVATALMLAVAFIVYRHSGIFVVPGSASYRPLDILAQLFLADRGTTLATPPFWTLAVEWRWYFVFPVVLFVWVRAPRAFAALVVLAVASYWFTRMHNLDFGVLPAFMLGIVAAHVQIHGLPIRRFAPLGIVVALVAALLIEPQVVMPDQFGVDQHAFFWQTNPGWQLVAFFGVVSAGLVVPVRTILAQPWCTAIGRASYSIYLVHYPIIAFLDLHLVHVMSSAAAFALSGLAAVLGGFAFFLVVERPLCAGEMRGRIAAIVGPAVDRTLRWLAVPGEMTLLARATVTRVVRAMPFSRRRAS